MSQDAFRERVLSELRAAAADGTLPGLDQLRVVDTDESVIAADASFTRCIVVRDGAESPHPRPAMPRGTGIQAITGVIVEWHEPLNGSATWIADYRAFKTALRKLLWTPNRFIEDYAPIPPDWKFDPDPSEDLSTSLAPGYHRTRATGSRRERDMGALL